ncbi:hypothetical protein ARMGADRAFT_1110998 [Armillaria gallica]|uniref:Uncharacterized protein n=1 Tax=Armillaria gallica TaxID=47427 RepID=A0A2H3DS11_ARMGA|nr:hypothetical protein ARMGADRAFT_1110998 [Armillaria gallica]
MFGEEVTARRGKLYGGDTTMLGVLYLVFDILYYVHVSTVFVDARSACHADSLGFELRLPQLVGNYLGVVKIEPKSKIAILGEAKSDILHFDSIDSPKIVAAQLCTATAVLRLHQCTHTTQSR